MADDKFFPETQTETASQGPEEKTLPEPAQGGNLPQAGGLPLDEAAGASLYLDSAADSGEINLDNLGLPPTREPEPGLPDSSEILTGPRQTRKPKENAGRSALNVPPAEADDFPKEALEASAAADKAKGQNEAAPDKVDRGRLTIIFHGFSAFFIWLWARIRAIPPLDDIFDNLLFSLGLQRKPGSMLRRANTLAHKGRLVEAVKWYRDYLALRPISVAGYDGLGRAYFRMGLSEEANREFTIADSLERILHNRDDVDAAAALAEAFMDRKQAKISVSLIEPVLISHFYSPGNSDLLKVMGRVYAELRANKKMYQVYQAGLEQHPGDYEFHILKGQADLKMGHTAEGERLIAWGRLMKKLKENPRDPQAKMSMGEIYIKEQKLDEGLKLLKEAAVLLPENTGIRWRLFNLYQKQGLYEESLHYFLEVVALEPENEDLKYRLADFYRKNKHREEALEIYQALADKHPREPKPRLMIGELYNEMGNFEEGQKMKDLAQILEIGLKDNPNHTETVRFIHYLASIGEVEESRQWLEKGLAKWPYHGEMVLAKVKILFNEHRYKDAVAMLKRLISVRPDMAEPHIWIAMCYQRQGDNMAAVAEAQLATRLAPKSFTAHKVLGDILKEQKKLSQANAAYEVAEMMRHKK